MEFKGTKGKWYIDQEESHQMKNNVWCNVISANKTIDLADVYGDDEEAKANAQLIASAPELLEMLQLTLIELESGAKGHWEITGMIKQLIEKATKID